jgi:hypothetical protein
MGAKSLISRKARSKMATLLFWITALVPLVLSSTASAQVEVESPQPEPPFSSDTWHISVATITCRPKSVLISQPPVRFPSALLVMDAM